MAMSCLLKASLNSCRGLASVSRARPLTSLVSLRLDQTSDQRRLLNTNLKLQAKPFGLLSQVEKFSTTPAVANSGVPHQHDHGKIWTLERLLSIALMPLFPLDVLYPNVLFDLLLSVVTVMHVHWGVEAVVVDYVRPIIFGKIIPKISLALVYVFSVVLLLGLLNLTFRGQGIGNSINTLWAM